MARDKKCEAAIEKLGYECVSWIENGTHRHCWAISDGKAKAWVFAFTLPVAKETLDSLFAIADAAQ